MAYNGLKLPKAVWRKRKAISGIRTEVETNRLSAICVLAAERVTGKGLLSFQTVGTPKTGTGI